MKYKDKRLDEIKRNWKWRIWKKKNKMYKHSFILFLQKFIYLKPFLCKSWLKIKFWVFWTDYLVHRTRQLWAEVRCFLGAQSSNTPAEPSEKFWRNQDLFGKKSRPYNDANRRVLREKPAAFQQLPARPAKISLRSVSAPIILPIQFQLILQTLHTFEICKIWKFVSSTLPDKNSNQFYKL